MGANAYNLDTFQPQQQQQPAPSVHATLPRTSFIDEEIYTALYSYDARTEDDLAFQQGDLLIILDNTRGAWWLAKHKNPPPSGYPHTQRSQGYIPSNYVARLNSNESFSWFVGQYPRQAAERDLNMAQNPYGAFLIRESESRQGDYSLSVKDQDGVKHYRIRKLDNGYFYIAPRAAFPSIDLLVHHYQIEADGLCCKESAGQTT